MSSSTATTTTTAGSAPVDRFPLRGPGTSVPGPLVVRAAAPRAVPGRGWGLQRTRGRGAERGRDVAASGKDPRTRDAPIGRASGLPGSVTDGGRRTRTARSGFRGLDAGVESDGRGRDAGARGRDGRTSAPLFGGAGGRVHRATGGCASRLVDGSGWRSPRPHRVHGCAARRQGRGSAASPNEEGPSPRGLGPSGGSAAQVPSVPRYRPITAGSSMSSRPVPV
ncbi:hypothetical protein SAMN04487788_2817 [Microbacterium testaceum StLB037]|uniref:Uncharacterized protein n=1 Tax=Microbacterium testaceum (strain StLB037) TaxID=979556 RepID=A0A1H0RC41_MICTS|nr:hypothetical protein SAMN04487788_2817 [Microbacterium testaceum StLB037]